MPMASKVWFVFWHYNQVALSGTNRAGTTGTFVTLASRIWLNLRDDLYAKSAHSTTAAVSAAAPTTIRMSVISRRWGRNGLNPMGQC